MNRRSMAAVLAVGVLFAGCGSGEDTTGEAEDATGETSEDGSPDASASADPAEEAVTEEPAADEGFCAQIADLDGQIDLSFDAVDPADLPVVLRDTADALGSVEGVPDELSVAWDELLSFYTVVIEALDGADDAASPVDALLAIEDFEARYAETEAAGAEIAAYSEETCGVALDDGAESSNSAGQSPDPCEMLDAVALETVFTAGQPQPELEDWGEGAAQCTWEDGEIEVWLTVMSPSDMNDFLEANGQEVDGSSLGPEAITYESMVGLARVSSGGGSVAFVSGETGVIVAVRGDAVDDPVATAIDLAERVP